MHSAMKISYKPGSEICITSLDVTQVVMKKSTNMRCHMITNTNKTKLTRETFKVHTNIYIYIYTHTHNLLNNP